MKRHVLKIAGTVAAITLLAAGSIIGTRAQTQSKPSTIVSGTNWVGYVVTGQEDTADRIARGAHPKADSRYEIGLRNDGVVVWRTTGKNN